MMLFSASHPLQPGARQWHAGARIGRAPALRHPSGSLNKARTEATALAAEVSTCMEWTRSLCIIAPALPACGWHVQRHVWLCAQQQARRGAEALPLCAPVQPRRADRKTRRPRHSRSPDGTGPARRSPDGTGPARHSAAPPAGAERLAKPLLEPGQVDAAPSCQAAVDLVLGQPQDAFSYAALDRAMELLLQRCV